MNINGTFVTNLYYYVTVIYDFLASVFTFVFENTASSAFSVLSEKIYEGFHDPIVATLVDGFIQIVALFIRLIGGGDMPLILFIFTVAIEVVLIIKIIKLAAKWT